MNKRKIKGMEEREMWWVDGSCKNQRVSDCSPSAPLGLFI